MINNTLKSDLKNSKNKFSLLFQKTVVFILLIVLSMKGVAQNGNDKKYDFPIFPISSETKYKHFSPRMDFKRMIRQSAKITFNEIVTTTNTMTKNECILLFDNRNCVHRRYNLLKLQDSLQYICDGYSIYTISHKTKEVTIEDAMEGNEMIKFMRDNPFVSFYAFITNLYPYWKKKNIKMFSNEEFVILDCFGLKTTFLNDDGYYSSKFRASDFALSEQKCLLKKENGSTKLYDATLISLEDENINNFTEKDFDASQWYDGNYTVTDKRVLTAKKQE